MKKLKQFAIIILFVSLSLNAFAQNYSWNYTQSVNDTYDSNIKSITKQFDINKNGSYSTLGFISYSSKYRDNYYDIVIGQASTFQTTAYNFLSSREVNYFTSGNAQKLGTANNLSSALRMCIDHWMDNNYPSYTETTNIVSEDKPYLNFALGSQFNSNKTYGNLSDKRDMYNHLSASLSYGLMTDNRTRKTYKTIKIGTQTWMAENLAFKASSGCWAYDNDESNIDKYGYLYNWETAKKVCPSGWHLPSDAEWTKLTNYLGGEDVAGGKLKSKIGWKSPGTGATNSSGFSALPGGNRFDYDGTFNYVGRNGYWWSTTEDSSNNAYNRYLNYDNADAYRYLFNKSNGFSVRCIRD